MPEPEDMMCEAESKELPTELVLAVLQALATHCVEDQSQRAAVGAVIARVCRATRTTGQALVWEALSLSEKRCEPLEVLESNSELGKMVKTLSIDLDEKPSRRSSIAEDGLHGWHLLVPRLELLQLLNVRNEASRLMKLLRAAPFAGTLKTMQLVGTRYYRNLLSIPDLRVIAYSAPALELLQIDRFTISTFSAAQRTRGSYGSDDEILGSFGQSQQSLRTFIITSTAVSMKVLLPFMSEHFANLDHVEARDISPVELEATMVNRPLLGKTFPTMVGLSIAIDMQAVRGADHEIHLLPPLLRSYPNLRRVSIDVSTSLLNENLLTSILEALPEGLQELALTVKRGWRVSTTYRYFGAIIRKLLEEGQLGKLEVLYLPSTEVVWSTGSKTALSGQLSKLRPALSVRMDKAEWADRRLGDESDEDNSEGMYDNDNVAFNVGGLAVDADALRMLLAQG